MIILDTNVVSELMSVRPDPAIVAWFDSQPSEELWLTAISVFELRFGLNALPDGARKRRLQIELERVLEEDFEGRVLAFDETAATAAATIAAQRRLIGRPIDVKDLQIAGIALCEGGTLATRNMKHFEGMGLALLNPWDAAT